MKQSVNRRILDILIPAIAENALLMLSGMILTGYMGRLSVSDISSYGIAQRIYGICFSVMKGFAIGSMVVFARALGAKDIRRCTSLYRQALVMIVPVALLVSVALFLFPAVPLSLMSDDPVLLTAGASYLRINVFVFPIIALVHMNSSAFQANGNTKTPLLIALIGNAVSIIFGYVLILGIGNIGGYGLTGAAVTSNLSIVVMAVCGVFLLYRKGGQFHEDPSLTLSLHQKDIRNIAQCGVPTGIGYSFWNIATVFISSVILSYGQEYYAAYQLGLQAEGLCDMMTAGFLTASMSLASQAIGGQDEDLYRQSWRILNRYCLIISGITMAFLAIGSKPVLSLLTDKTELIPIAATYMYCMILSQYPQHRSIIIYGYLRSAGYTTIPTVIDMIGIWIVRVGLSYIFGTFLHWNIIWIWMIINADQWVRALLSLAVFHLRRLDQMPLEKAQEV